MKMANLKLKTFLSKYNENTEFEISKLKIFFKVIF